MMAEFQVTLREAPPLLVFDLRGAVTVVAKDAINHAYRAACERGAKNLLLNFSAAEHLDSAGIAAIIGILTEARKVNQRLLVTGLTPHYRKIFDFMGLSQYAPVFDTEDDARRWVESQ